MGAQARDVDYLQSFTTDSMIFRTGVRRRTGFTLVETIVTLGLLAVLAAFVVPTVVQKAGAGDPVKVVSDLTSIRTGLETFQTDVGGVPNQLRMLVVQPTVANHFVDSVTVLKQSNAIAWNGPYLNAEIGALPQDSLMTGFRSYIYNQVTRYDGTNNAAEFYVLPGSGTGGTFTPTNTLFAAVTITGLSVRQAQLVNRLIDGDDDTDVLAGANAGANMQGRFRYDRPNANAFVVAYYMATPLSK
jgi:prepilin-type N-terminal cleavage/methylation domain-containing protein